MSENEDLFKIVDLLASEYGWTIDYIQNLTSEEIQNLAEKIIERKKLEWTIQTYIVNCAFMGKKPQFNTADKEVVKEVDQETFIKLMKKIGGKVEEVEK